VTFDKKPAGRVMPAGFCFPRIPTFSTGATRKCLPFSRLRIVDRRPHIIPRAVAGDSHVEIAAEGRIPKMHRGSPFSVASAFAAFLAATTRPSESLIQFPSLLRHGLT